MAAPKYLTFSQRYGYEPIPGPMQVEELSHDLRLDIWNITRQYFQTMNSYSDALGQRHFTGENGRFFEYILGKILKIPEDEISTSRDRVFNSFKELILDSDFNIVLDLVETILNVGGQKQIIPHFANFANDIGAAFRRHAAAYQLMQVKDQHQSTFQFFPQSSEEQGQAVQQAIETIQTSAMRGASAHLRDAVKKISDGDFAGSVADSIHAVESVARMIAPEANKTLRPALTSLSKAGAIKHHKFTGAFFQLYDYTNEEQGIRHALLDKDAPDVDIDEAVFMFGACASFAAYLVNKYQKMNHGRG